MINNSYLKLLVIAGLPITVFLTVFFSLMLGLYEGLFPGLIIGVIVGTIISVILGFFYSQPVKESLVELFAPAKQKNLKIVFLPYLVILLGALFTRYSGKILPSFALTIILSMTIFLLLIHFMKELKTSLQTTGRVANITYTITRLIPFTFSYFIFLFVIYGFNFEKIKGLFKL